MPKEVFLWKGKLGMVKSLFLNVGDQEEIV
jgi:hypothetical protein